MSLYRIIYSPQPKPHSFSISPAPADKKSLKEQKMSVLQATISKMNKPDENANPKITLNQIIKQLREPNLQSAMSESSNSQSNHFNHSENWFSPNTAQVNQDYIENGNDGLPQILFVSRNSYFGSNIPKSAMILMAAAYIQEVGTSAFHYTSADFRPNGAYSKPLCRLDFAKFYEHVKKIDLDVAAALCPEALRGVQVHGNTLQFDYSNNKYHILTPLLDFISKSVAQITINSENMPPLPNQNEYPIHGNEGNSCGCDFFLGGNVDASSNVAKSLNGLMFRYKTYVKHSQEYGYKVIGWAPTVHSYGGPTNFAYIASRDSENSPASSCYFFYSSYLVGYGYTKIENNHSVKIFEADLTLIMAIWNKQIVDYCTS